MKKSGRSRNENKTFFSTTEPLAFKTMEGDGNCLFRAISFAVTGEEDQHTMVRRMICDFIASTEGIKVKAMRKNKVWGTTTEILAAPDMFHVNVYVWAKFGQIHTWHVHRPKGNVKLLMSQCTWQILQGTISILLSVFRMTIGESLY